MSKARGILHFLRGNRIVIIWISAFMLFILSFIQIPQININRETKKMERRLHHREKILEKYVARVFETAPDEWPDIKELPEDMVIYKYVADTLQSWFNLFPINNDDLDVLTPWHRIHDLGNLNQYNTPLSYVRKPIQYLNLGHEWYIIKTDRKEETTILSGIKIRTQYTTENSILKNKNNPHLGLDDRYTTEASYIDDAHTVKTLSGEELFSVHSENSFPDNSPSSLLLWLSMLLAAIALITFHISHRSGRSLIITFAGTAVLHISASVITHNMMGGGEFFSPTLYADGGLFNSLASMIICHSFIFIYILLLFISRRMIVTNALKAIPVVRRTKLAGWIFTLCSLFVYIHITLTSLIGNSNINMDFYRINLVSGYTLIIYVSYALLFLGALFIIYIISRIMYLKRGRKRSVFSLKRILIYLSMISLYIVATIDIYGFRKECDSIRVLTGRLAVERDLSLEIELQSIEKAIISDPLIKMLITSPNNSNMIYNTLIDRYFWNISQNYYLRITACPSNIVIAPNGQPLSMNCSGHFEEVIRKYGEQLNENSAFYYLDYFKNTISYLGAFSILGKGIRYNLFIEIDSKENKDNAGYPLFLLNSDKLNHVEVPFIYSYAKYSSGKLTGNSGDYNFPVSVDLQTISQGFSYKANDGNIIFYNKYLNNNMVILTRGERRFFDNVIFFSYIFLFFSIFILGTARIVKNRNRSSILNIPRSSFRMRITVLLTVSLLIALIFMGISSVIFAYKYINDNQRSQMEEKIFSVQSTLAKIASVYDRFNELNTPDMFNTMDIISQNTMVDINLFDPFGKLIRSTKPEMFNEYLVGTRMNPKAYHDIIYLKKMQSIQEEHISEVSYHSLYTPIYNDRGSLLAIANIPYFISDSGFKNDLPTLIATIVNLYLLMTIGVLLIGIAISNSLSKPLKAISKSMQEVNISNKAEHIDYKGKDELGQLVKNYNQMIDELEKSTRELTKREREEAWSSMARQIAHEIKNPLTPMKLSIQHLVRLKKQGVPDWEKRFDSLSSSLLEQIEILTNTANEFSSFAKFYNDEISRIDLISLISEQITLFDNYDHMEIEFIHSEEEAFVLSRKSQITRVFVNLITNAIQALEANPAGLVRISITTVKNSHVIDIEDNGPGVSKENLSKLFTPNFTTKSRGTGLGLAICRTIINDSQGEIHYSRSSSLGGADFTISLPKA